MAVTEEGAGEREMDRILCDELLEEVLRRLPPRSTFSPSAADVSLVSKRWLRLYRSSVSDVSLSLSVDNCVPRPMLSQMSSGFWFSGTEEVKMASMVDDTNAYSYLYPVQSPSKKIVFKCLELHWRSMVSMSISHPIIQEAMNYACASGGDCDSIQPNGSCFLPNTLLAHASYAFNSYWQRTKVAGGTCEFGGTAMLVTVDPSYDGCHFVFY